MPLRLDLASWTGQVTLKRLRKIDFTRIDRTVVGLPMRRRISCEMAHRLESVHVVVLSGWLRYVGLREVVLFGVAA